MDLFNSSKLTSSPDTSQVKHVGSSPHAILDQNQEHANTSGNTDWWKKYVNYNYGEKNHKNDLAQLFDSGSASHFSLPLSSFPSPIPFSPFSRETTGDESGKIEVSSFFSDEYCPYYNPPFSQKQNEKKRNNVIDLKKLGLLLFKKAWILLLLII